ncbi:hypothetical protein [Hydrogenophaga sp. OTU3427]
MKYLLAAIASAFLLASMPSMAASHGGGKMEDCSKKENADKAECKKK